MFFYQKAVSIFIFSFCLSAYADTSLNTDLLYIKKSDKSKVSLNVEIADTHYKREKGLMRRQYMPKNNGMLFVFDNKDIVNFWMKDTYIPLDILFITEKGVISKIVKNTTPLSLESISSDVRVIAVLEINAMLSDELLIKENDIVIHPYFNNINLLY